MLALLQIKSPSVLKYNTDLRRFPRVNVILALLINISPIFKWLHSNDIGAYFCSAFPCRYQTY